MDSIVKLRLTAEEKERWQSSADAAGVSLSEWVRRRCNEDGEPVRSYAMFGLPKEIRVVTVIDDFTKPDKAVELMSSPVEFERAGPVESAAFVPSPPAPPPPKRYDFSKCIQPYLKCSLMNRPLCGPCKELNQ